MYTITDEMIKKEVKQEVKHEMIQEINIKQEVQITTNSLSPPMRPPPEKKFKPTWCIFLFVCNKLYEAFGTFVIYMM